MGKTSDACSRLTCIEFELSRNFGIGCKRPGRCNGCGILSPPNINRPSRDQWKYRICRKCWTYQLCKLSYFHSYTEIIFIRRLPSVCFPYKCLVCRLEYLPPVFHKLLKCIEKVRELLFHTVRLYGRPKNSTNVIRNI